MEKISETKKKCKNKLMNLSVLKFVKLRAMRVKKQINVKIGHKQQNYWKKKQNSRNRLNRERKPRNNRAVEKTKKIMIQNGTKFDKIQKKNRAM